MVKALEALLSVPRAEILAEIGRRAEEAKTQKRELERERLRSMQDTLARKAETAETVGGIRVLAHRVDGLSSAETRSLADGLRRKLGTGVVILGRADEGKASLLVAVTDDRKDVLPAGELVRELARIVGGGGGGKNDIAEAGGKDASRLDEALRAGVEIVARRLGASA